MNKQAVQLVGNSQGIIGALEDLQSALEDLQSALADLRRAVVELKVESKGNFALGLYEIYCTGNFITYFLGMKPRTPTTHQYHKVRIILLLAHSNIFNGNAMI